MKKKGNPNALKTLIAGFILHFILGTFHTWQSILRYFNSFLLEFNDTPIHHKYLETIFAVSNVTHGLSMCIGVILTGWFSSLKITGAGLMIRTIAESLYIVFPNIKIVTLNIFISSIANGLVYLPVILDVLRYYPKSKGKSIAFVLYGFGINRLIFKYISIYLIDPDSVEMIHGTQSYPSIINNNFKLYLKMYLMFYSLLSVLCVYLIHPYQPKKIEIEERPFNKRKLTTDPSTFANLINIDKNFKEEDQNKVGDNNDEDESEDDDHYIKYLLDKICCKKKKLKNGEKVQEPFSSLIISYPFIQLTFIFFFTMIIGFVELSSIRKLGSLNGHSEFFLWKTSFLFKAFNATTLPLWGFILDKIGFKSFYSVILIVQIIISSMCFFISSNQVGFILYNGISALLHSVNLAIQLTTYVLIFGNEKGVLLYSISWMLIYIFYIARPFISNIFVSKIQYLMFYIFLTLFTMIALIILSFFVEKKHVYIDTSKGDENSDEDKELEDMKFEESESDEDDEEDNIENKKKE